jgi:hypothetical protein
MKTAAPPSAAVKGQEAIIRKALENQLIPILHIRYRPGA